MRTGVSSGMGARRIARRIATSAALLVPGPPASAVAAAAGPSSPPLGPRAPVVAYVTETARTPATIWTVRTDGTDLTRVGPGDDPLIAPSGQQVAPSLFGTGTGTETGPALAIYWNEEDSRPPLQYFNLAHE